MRDLEAQSPRNLSSGHYEGQISGSFGPLQHLGARVEEGAGVGLLLGLTRRPTQEQEAAGIGDR